VTIVTKRFIDKGEELSVHYIKGCVRQTAGPAKVRVCLPVPVQATETMDFLITIIRIMAEESAASRSPSSAPTIDPKVAPLGVSGTKVAARSLLATILACGFSALLASSARRRGLTTSQPLRAWAVLPVGAERSSDTDSWDENPLQQIRRNFEASGIDTFLSMYRNVSMPRERKLVTLSLHGGLSDRIKAVQFGVALAALTGRQLVVGPSLFMEGAEVPAEFEREPRITLYSAACGLTGKKATDWSRKALHHPARVITLTTNCGNWRMIDEALTLLSGRSGVRSYLSLPSLILH
jgi:hypothetical protein